MAGRIAFYNGNEALAKKIFKSALEIDPDNQQIKNANKNIKLSADLKE